MVFSNSVFLFLFLPIVLLGYYLLRGRARNYWLLAVSLVFYAWNKPAFLLILLGSIALNYVGALLVDKAQKKKAKFLWLSLTVTLNLGLLYYFKYFNFTMDILQKLLNRTISFTEVVLPIGISFFTFQALSYVVDVYREQVSVQKNPFKLGMYISLFPQLVAGPIVRYKDVAAEIDNRSVSLDDFVCGIRRFIIGLFKKIIIADTLAITANAMFDRSPALNAPEFAWLGIICYSLQLFFDFAGYSDMAIGLGRMFGFHFLENFNYPYISKSITEFWRRWNMSLSSFFRDYVYIPLGGNRKRVYLNVAIVFLLTGIWHGANYTFIAWGIWHGLFNLIEKVLRGKKKKDPSPLRKGLSATLGRVYTLLVVIIGWVFFRASDLHHGVDYVKSMFGLLELGAAGYETLGFYLDRWTLSVLIVGLVMATPLPKLLLEKASKKLPTAVCDIAANVVLLLALLLCVLQVASNTFSAFIYFQF